MINLMLEDVEKLSKQYNVVPIIETLFSGSETPLAVFERVAAGKQGTFLLESAEHGVWSRYSFIGLDARGCLRQEDGSSAEWVSADGLSALPVDQGTELDTAPLVALEQLQRAWVSAPLPNIPPLTSGLVGVLGWNTIREIENLQTPKVSSYDFPTMLFLVLRDVIVFDHQEAKIHFVSNLFIEGQSSDQLAKDYEDVANRIQKLKREVLDPSDPYLADFVSGSSADVSSNHTPEGFRSIVNQAKRHIEQGDVFQVVLSQRFDAQTQASPTDVYRALRAINPSPYMYLLNLEDSSGKFAIVGSSPEALVKVQAGKATMHPIAGSKPRGSSIEQDNSLAEQLLGDEKERAEHLMLVDLARNDLLKVCEAQSVAVTEFMKIHKFSHIQHLVSTVEGVVREDISNVEVFKATFPAGTLSGAPKPKALEIIDDLEHSNRGLFGGVVGYFDFAGNADLAIAIRTAVMRDGVAHIQAGAGIVLDSNPATEFEETRTKAAVLLRAIDMASSLSRVSR